MATVLFFWALVLGLIGGLISTSYSIYARQMRLPVGEWFDGTTTITLIGGITFFASLISLFVWLPTLYALGSVVVGFFVTFTIVQTFKSWSQLVALLAIVASWALGAAARFLV